MFKVTQINHLDKDQWEELYKQYATFYSMDMTQSTLDTVWAWINDKDFAFYAAVIKNEAMDIIGIAHYRAMPSPVRGTMVGFLDDLFILPEYRGGKATKEIFNYLRTVSQTNQWPFIRWITKEDNYRARGAYDKYASKTQWVTYQLEC